MIRNELDATVERFLSAFSLVPTEMLRASMIRVLDTEKKREQARRLMVDLAVGITAGNKGERRIA